MCEPVENILSEIPSDNTAPNSESQSVWRFALRALSHRNYRLFFSGQSVSLIGTWMTRIATSWLVYRLTGSAWLLGLVGFAGQIPVFLLAPFAGVWIDRWSRHRTLVVTQVLAMLQSFALAGLTLAKVITIPEIFWLSMAQGLINAFDMPARQAFVVEMIGKREDLSSAIALNSSMVNAARLLGPAIAGVVIAAVGEGYCYLMDGFSYIAVIISLLLMSVALGEKRPARAVLEELREGWNYVRHFSPVRSVLLLLVVVSLMGMPFTVLMPIFAGSVLHGGPHTLGFLMGSVGVGALLSAAYLAARRSVIGLGRIIPISAALFGAGLIAFSLSRWLWLSMLLLLMAGAGMMQQMAASNTMLQTIVDDDKRGRVMAFYSVSIMGMTPFGSLVAGFLASHITAPGALMVGGVCCLLGAGWFARQLPSLRVLVRPIYVRLGILPEIVTGIQQASAVQEE
jgi:MFS family permease